MCLSATYGLTWDLGMQPTESTDLKYGKCAYTHCIHTHTHPYTTTHTLTVHIHSQSEGVRSCNFACCNLVHSTVITSDVSNSQTSSSDSEPCVIDGHTLLGQSDVVNTRVSFQWKREGEQLSLCWCCSSSGS